MAILSQTSLMEKLSHAEQLHQHITSLADYKPEENELTTGSLRIIIDELTKAQEEYSVKQQEFNQALQRRKNAFSNSPTSIIRSIALINAYLLESKGVESTEYTSVNTLVKKIREGRPIVVKTNDTTDKLHRTEKDYDEQLQNFSAILELLKQFKTGYAPSNLEIKTETLQTLILEIQEINDLAKQKHKEFKTLTDKRKENLEEMLKTTQGIKNKVKAQFKVASTEFNAIKNLRF